PLPGHRRDPAPLLEASLRATARPGLPRSRQPLRPRGGGPTAQGPEQAPADGARHFNKSDGLLRQGGPVIFSFIQQHREVWPVTLMCDTLGVSPAGFYAWRSRPQSEQQQRRDALLVEIAAVHAEVKGRYGSPRVHAELAA